MEKRKEFEFEITSFSDIPPFGFFSLLDYNIIIQTEEKLYSRYTKHDYSIKITSSEETEKEEFLDTLYFFSYIFSLGFKRSFKFFNTGLHRSEQIEKLRTKHPSEYNLVFSVMIKILEDIYQQSENEKTDKKSKSPYSRFIRSIRKYQMALENKYNPIEFFEDMWIALEALFYEGSYKYSDSSNDKEIRRKFEKEIKVFAKELRKTETDQINVQTINNLTGKIINSIWTEGISFSIKNQFKEKLLNFNSFMNEIFNVDETIKKFLPDEKIKIWYENRNNLFHDAKISDIRSLFMDYGREIEKTLRLLYYIF